jgi:membrane-associated phospholipid phosphatase
LQIFGRFLLSYLIAYGFSTLFFVLYPTTFPRELFPLEGVEGFSAASLSWFREFDRPTNCLPSMHVASCMMVTLPFWAKQRRLFWTFLGWSLAISVATLTTKQHYVVDVVTGAGFGISCHFIAALRQTTQKALAVESGRSTPPAPG